jgi:hypothetical protein
MNDTVNCIKCGQPMQPIFVDTGHGFKGGFQIVGTDNGRWVVCINPNCEDGKHNVGQDSNMPELI